MKILSIGTDRKLFESGSEVARRQIVLAEKLGRLEIIVFANRDLSLTAFDLSPKLRVIPTNSRNRWFYIFDAIRLGKNLPHPDLVTAQDPFECGFIGWRLARFFRAELELQIHADIGSPYFRRESLLNQIRFWLARFLLPRADKIRVVSKRIADFLRSTNWGIKTILEIRPIAIDTEKIRTAPIIVDLHKKYPQFDKIILMASRLSREKNIGLAIEVMNEVAKQNPQIGLIIVGSGSEGEKLRRKVGVPIEASGLKAKSYQLLGNIIFENWVDQEILYSYYKTADLFLNTSWYEGYGMTLVEAHAAGCKIISTDVGVAREVGAKIISRDYSNVAREILGTLK